VVNRHFKGMTVDQVKELLPYSEFLSWAEFFRRENRKRDKLEHYLAGLRLEIVRFRHLVASMVSKNLAPLPATVTAETFLLEHTERKKEHPKKRANPAGDPNLFPGSDLSSLAMAKAVWAGRLGVDLPEGKA
jgi:hypothetical protein